MRWLVPWIALALLPRPAAAADPILVESGDDTAVYRFLPNLARGDYSTLYAFTLADGGQQHDFRTFLRFAPLPDLAGACVEFAAVYVYYGFDFTGFGSGENVPGALTCEPVLAPWAEATTTWNNQPPIGAATGLVTGITAFDYLACDVTPIVQGWADGVPDHGVALSSPTARVMGFYSFEAQVDPVLRPALAITLADDPLACPEPGLGGAMAVTFAALAALRARRRR
jgi:hypothetical protein